jgi:ABC-type bacteriocin/lantibiotic exporter with double-glycine peptidase domain
MSERFTMTARSRRRIQSVVIWLLTVAALPAVAPATAAPAGELPPGGANRSCGPNSLYLLLRLSGATLSYHDVAPYYPTHPNGMSMLELKRACADFGLTADLRHCTQADLRVIPLPVIAHVHDGPEGEVGHYVVIFHRLGRDRIKAIDGTTGKIREFLIDKMDDIWKGNLLVPRPAMNYPIIVIGLLVLVSQLAGFLIVLRWLQGPSLSSPRT